jgi:tripartite-type tricarboxylate transporter receptor subunit TctC
MGYAVNPSMYAKLPYDTLKDFERVTVVARTPHVLVLHPLVPFRSLPELIAYARAQPEQITFASSGVGTAGHLCLELLKSMTGIRVTHVPFKGTESVGAVVGGQVQMLFTAIAAVMPQIKAGRLKPLVTTGSARSPELPEVPTAAESGLKGYEVVGFYGVLAPGGTPPEIVARLRDEIVRAIQVPEIKTRLEGLGFEPVGSTPEEFTELVKGEMAKWARVIKDAGIKPEL